MLKASVASTQPSPVRQSKCSWTLLRIFCMRKILLDVNHSLSLKSQHISVAWMIYKAPQIRILWQSKHSSKSMVSLFTKCIKESISLYSEKSPFSGCHLHWNYVLLALHSDPYWDKHINCPLSAFLISFFLYASLLCFTLTSHVPAQPLSCVGSFATPWTVANQAALSMGFFRQEYWSGLPCPAPGDLPDSGMETTSPVSLALAGGFFTTKAPRKPYPNTYLLTS